MQTVEPLYTCPLCQRSGFSFQGIHRHHCRAKPGRARLTSTERADAIIKSMPKGNHKPTTRSAQIVLSDRALATTSAPQLQSLQEATLKTMRLIETEQVRIDGADAANTMRRVFVGFALQRVKLSLKHGDFLPWLKAHAPVSHKQCTFYMRLAVACCERVKLTKPDLLTLPGDQVTLELDSEGTGRDFAAKVAKFCSDLGFTDLLIREGIKDAPKKPALPAPREGADDRPIDPELAAQTARENLAEWLSTGRQILIDENLGQHLTPAELREIDTEAAAILATFRKGHRAALKTTTKRAA